MAQPNNRTTRRPSSKGMVTIMPAVSLCVLTLLVCVVFAGCQTPNSTRPGTLNTGVVSERLTYRQYQFPQQNQASQPPSHQGLIDLLNPFKSRANRNGNIHSSVSGPENLRHSVQSQPASQLSAELPDNTPNPMPVLRKDDPPEIVEFAMALAQADQFSVAQQAEIIELLRRESPAMRGNMIANYMAAIRLSDPASNPIVQATHVASIRDRDFDEPPIRLANTNIEDEFAALESQALGHALFTPENMRSMVRQVADESTPNASTFRIGRPRGTLGAIPEINTNPTLPTVAAPDDYAALHQQESLKPVADANRLETVHDEVEILRLSQPRSPEEPDIKSREITSYQQSDTRLGHRVTGPNGTRIAIVDSNTRVPSIIPSLTVMEDDKYDIADIPQIPGMTINPEVVGADSAELAAQTYSGNAETMVSLDLQPTPQIRNITPSFQQERWDETARRALNLLSAQIADSGDLEHKEQLHDEINQRLMSLTLGNQRDAIRVISGLPPELQEFWRNTMLGLSTILDDVSFPDASYRFDAAHRHLQTANLYLQNLCPVRIRKVSFINQCDGFGVYETASNEFRRSEPMFIYAEIDNLSCRESDGGYLTQVNSSYEIIDVFGNKVASGEFSKTGKQTQSRIRDIFLLWRVDLPENIMPGKYFINLSVIDTNHQDYPFDQQRLELNILSSLSSR